MGAYELTWYPERAPLAKLSDCKTWIRVIHIVNKISDYVYHLKMVKKWKISLN